MCFEGGGGVRPSFGANRRKYNGGYIRKYNGKNGESVHGSELFLLPGNS